ncbi:amino acid adenylation domain-containing protein [Nocardia goodfellowii]|uniref:amino acid adenylation domain-containing protein n=1 Tax=Nocardia goodfellowii TaxID=882446 RepID=UPI0027DD5AD2|nr:amino acid adenylation domain-containing protein [Nocardia goodfellowii]
MLTVVPEAAVCPSYPLSQAQWAWWLAQKLHPGVPVTVAMYLDLAGPIDVELIENCATRAGQELGASQLRFRLVDGTPRQYIDSAARLRFDRVDLTTVRDPVATALDRMERDYSTPLDPLADELTVAMVFAVAPQRHLLYLRSHHIVLDGVGAAAVLRRTAELYRAQVGADSAGEGVPACGALSVAEILEDERAYRESARARDDRDYWRDQLAGWGDSISLAGRAAPPTVRPHQVTATLDTATARLLAAAKARHGATFPELAIAAFACYLARLTGSPEAMLTLPVPARSTAALRRSGGSMSNVVPLRMTGLDASTVGAVIAQVRSTVIGALRHQRYRHEDMRRMHEAALSGFGPVVNLLGLVEPLRLGPIIGHARLLALGPVADLQVNGYQAGPDETSVNIDFQANPARYRYETVVWRHRMFLDYFARFLAAEPDSPVMAVDRTPAAPTMRPPLGPVRTMPELLCASMMPDAVAVRCDTRTLTYRELDEASSRWARVLLAGGAGPGNFVVVAIARSLESVLALWAVAKTGACFVPLDPADPPARLTAVLTSSPARQGLTVRSVYAELPDVGRTGIDWLVLDDPETDVEHYSAAPVDDAERPRPLRPGHPAYVIYTSGTTGVPKGVVVSHRGLGSLTGYLIEHYGIERDSVLLHSHTSTFDAHLLELLPTFAAGAQVVVAPPSVIAGDKLARLILDSGCTILQTAPAVLSTLSPAQVPALTVVAIGGEACPAKLVAEWAPHVRLFNGYGPTEATVMTTETAAMSAEDPVTIGVALPGALAVVLDSRLRRVPDGARGELYLGGLGLADYYLGSPAATATRFLADPFGSGGRLYRTGDQVGVGPGGAFEFYGRLDGQVQLHGRRIEPAEIEAALLAEPEITYAVVTVADPGRPEARLVGYVVAAARIDTAATLRRLRAELPSALVPSALVQLDRLPVAGNGKVDRAALTPPVVTPRPYRAPQTELERLVADRFAATLALTAVGLDDDFFELGGNSLLGVGVSADLELSAGVPVTVRWLYTSPTVRLLADAIANYDATDTADDALGALLALRRGGTRPPLFCVHSAVPLAWCYAGLARYVTDRPIYGLQAPVLAAGGDIPATIDGLVDSYIETMLGVQPQGPYHLLGWSLGGQIAHAIAVRLRARGAVVAVLAMLDSVVIPAEAEPPPAPRMRDLLTHLLGDEPEDADDAPDITAAEAAAELAIAGASFGTGLSAGQLERLHRGYVAGVMLAHNYRPDVYDGDLLYFSATRGITEMFDARMWRPYVTGELIEHPVLATHAQMTNSEVVAVIGPILDRHLARVEGPMVAPDGP